MDPCSITLQDIRALSVEQRTALKKVNIKNIEDVILTPPGDIAKQLKTSLSEAQTIIEIVCKELARISPRLDGLEEQPDDKLTTGDSVLDDAIGGGIRTGMLWEIVGESASGKTQLALQLCLLVQVRPMLGGLSGSACYLSTHSQLSTKRLIQLIADHPLLSPAVCSLSDIHTIAIPTVELLMRTLTSTFPALQDGLRKDPSRKPVRLIIIDSISALFHSSGKSSSSALFERSKALLELSRVMHEIASRGRIAFVAINEVTDVFHDYYSTSQEGASRGDVLYREQAKWFNSAHSLSSESSKEACLGLVWANQVNARIMLTRTTRRKYLDDSYPLTKRRQIDRTSAAIGLLPTSPRDESEGEDSVLLRRLTVVFNSVSAPCSVDFIVTSAGVSAVHKEMPSDAHALSKVLEAARQVSSSGETLHGTASETAKATLIRWHSANGDASQQFINARTLPTVDDAVVIAPGRIEEIPSTYPEVDGFDDDNDAPYWEGIDDIPNDSVQDIDFEGLERSQIEEFVLGPSEVQIAVSSR